MDLKHLSNQKDCGITLKKARRCLESMKMIKSIEHLNESSTNYKLKIVYVDGSEEILEGDNERISKMIEFI